VKAGDRVQRVSLRTTDPAEGRVGEQGTIDRVFLAHQKPFGLSVIWDAEPQASQYVLPARVRAAEVRQQ
jgi:hypothetical protein